MTGISVIVPTFNSQRTILNCLRSIGDQTTRCSKVIVVDRFSRDETVKMANSCGATIISSPANRSGARNLGATASDSSAVLFIDSDMILPRTLIEECEEGLRTHSALIIPEDSVGSGFWAACKSIERHSYRNNDLIEAARCFKRNVYSDLGGYDSALEAGEDWDLHSRARNAGVEIGRVKSAILHDEGDLKLLALIRKKFAYGRTMGEYLKLNPVAGINQLNPVSRVLGTSIKIIPSDPKHGAGFLVLKTLEFA